MRDALDTRSAAAGNGDAAGLTGDAQEFEALLTVTEQGEIIDGFATPKESRRGFALSNSLDVHFRP